MSTRFRLQLPRSIWEAMLAQARAELPNECCGLLAGRLAPDQGSRIVLKQYPLVNELTSPTEFLSEPRSMFAAEKEMRKLGLEVLAVYHSHPNSDPIPSKKDLERSYGEQVICLIISMRGSEPAMRAWWLTEKGYQEAELEWVAG